MLPLLLLLFVALVAALPVPEAPRQLDIGTSQGFIDAGKMLAAAMNTSLEKGVPTIGEPDFYQNEAEHAKEIRAYKQFVFETVSLIASDAGVEISKKKLREDIEKVFELEKRQTMSGLNEPIMLDEMNKTNILKLSQLHTAFPLPRYFKLLAPSLFAYFDADPDVDVYNLPYLQRLKELLNETDSRVVADYIFFSYAQTFMTFKMPLLDSRYAEIGQRLAKIIKGPEASPPERSIMCRSAVQGLNHAISALYIENHFNEEAKAATEAMIEEIKEAFRESIEGNEWMDNNTRNEALKKLGSVIRKIGYPDWILDDAKLDSFYEALDVLPTDSFAEGMAKFLKWQAHFAFGLLLEPIDRFDFAGNPAAVNAYYNKERNDIYFPAAILQPPFFCHGFPLALNYGAIGTIIGHEFTHGFDDNGKNYDGNGNKHDWWKPETKNKFEERSQCFVEQYSAEHFDRVRLNVNGRLTLGENIADNGGIKQSFQAYRKHLQTHGPEPRTPLVDQLTNEQLFFVGYAQPWCRNVKTERLAIQLRDDEHSPDSTRVKVVLSNLPEFAEAYNCPVGSAMNPGEEKRCSVW